MADTISYPTPRPAAADCPVTGDLCIPTGGGNTDNGDDGETPGEKLPPVVTILTPANLSIYTFGDPVPFTGTGIDPLDGDISANIVWSSSEDGELGTGASLPISDLTVNQHVITATVTNSLGLSDSDTITITVAADVVYGDMNNYVNTFVVNPQAPNWFQDVSLASLGIPDVDITKAFVKLCNTMPGSGGPADYPMSTDPEPAGSEARSANTGIYLYLLNSTTLRVHRPPVNVSVDRDETIAIEIREYAGAAAGPWEFKVRGQGAIAMTSGSLTGHEDVVGVSDYLDTVPFFCGGGASEGTNGGNLDRAMPILIADSGGLGLDWERKDSANTAYIGYALVEFTGSNWTVFNNLRINTITESATEETHTLPGATDVGDWAECFIENQWTQNEDSVSSDLDKIGMLVYPRLAVTTDIHTWSSQNGLVGVPDLMLHIVKGTGLSVQHMHSPNDILATLDRGVNEEMPYTYGRSMTSAVAHRSACWMDGNSATDTLDNVEATSGYMLYDINELSTLSFWNTSFYFMTAVIEWSIQIIEFPEV